jgi:hypothetical protein
MTRIPALKPKYFLLTLLFAVAAANARLAAQPATAKLEQMPVALETEYALSALPTHLRGDASVYLLDPKKGLYLARKGNNGFVCFVARTEWEWVEFRDDVAAPISFDAEGARTILPLYIDIEQMRASGQVTPQQLRDTMMSRIRRGYYKAPSRAGISYMLSPIMRVYHDDPRSNKVVTMSMPHVMFYAPWITNKDVGIEDNADHEPWLINAGQWLLGFGKSPYGYLIVPVGEAQTHQIREDGKKLVDALAQYNARFVVSEMDHH